MQTKRTSTSYNLLPNRWHLLFYLLQFARISYQIDVVMAQSEQRTKQTILKKSLPYLQMYNNEVKTQHFVKKLYPIQCNYVNLLITYINSGVFLSQIYSIYVTTLYIFVYNTQIILLTRLLCTFV